MTKISFATLQQRYPGKYVLLDKPDGKIVAVSKDLDRAFKQAEKKGYPLPAVQFIPSNGLKMYEVSLRKNTD